MNLVLCNLKRAPFNSPYQHLFIWKERNPHIIQNLELFYYFPHHCPQSQGVQMIKNTKGPYGRCSGFPFSVVLTPKCQHIRVMMLLILNNQTPNSPISQHMGPPRIPNFIEVRKILEDIPKCISGQTKGLPFFFLMVFYKLS